MTRDEFLREQYLTLREEIRETKDRIFKIAAIGLFVAPGGHYLARTMDAGLLLLFLPILVISVAVLYLAENHALMRCGRYIRLHVETEIPDLCAWEEWLETPDACRPRSVDQLSSYSMYIILGAYYLASILVAYRQSHDTYGPAVTHVLTGFYVGLGVIFLFFLLQNVRGSTTTLIDPPPTKRVRA